MMERDSAEQQPEDSGGLSSFVVMRNSAPALTKQIIGRTMIAAMRSV
jgi:hypothetical protein